MNSKRKPSPGAKAVRAYQRRSDRTDQKQTESTHIPRHTQYRDDLEQYMQTVLNLTLLGVAGLAPLGNRKNYGNQLATTKIKHDDKLPAAFARLRAYTPEPRSCVYGCPRSVPFPGSAGQ